MVKDASDHNSRGRLLKYIILIYFMLQTIREQGIMHMREVLESYTKSDSFHSVSSPLNPALKLAGLW